MTTQTVSAPTVSGDTALRIALADAGTKYDDLHLYHIALRLEPQGWRVEFEFKDEDAQSGGPHYVIDAASGAILHATYYQ